MKIYFGDVDENHTLEEAISLAPSWSNMFISRFENGWVFVNSHGRYFVTDNNDERGWISTDTEKASRLYKLLGRRVSKVYYEE